MRTASGTALPMLSIISIITAILLLLFGCTSQQQPSELQKNYDDLKNQYSDLQNRHAALQSERNQLEQEKNGISKSLDDRNGEAQKLSSDYESLNSGYLSLKANYSSLSSSYSSLRSLYDSLTLNYKNLNDNYRNLQSQTGRLPKDIPGSPSIGGLDFMLSKDSLIIKYPLLNLSSVTDTKSMNPTITAENTAIFTTKFDRRALQVGDIIAYNSSSFELPIMHRIISVDHSNGLCYIVQGDNNPVPDPDCVYPSQVIGLVVGTIYNRAATGYRYCADGLSIAANDEFYCLPDNLPAGVYTDDQKIASTSFTGYPLCSSKEPDKPYTVVTPGKKVYCYDSVS